MFLAVLLSCRPDPPPEPEPSEAADTGSAPTETASSTPTGATGDTAVPGDTGLPGILDYVVTLDAPGASFLPALGLQQTPDGPRVLAGAGAIWSFDAATGVDRLLTAADAAWPATRLWAVAPDVDGDGFDDLWTGDLEVLSLQSGAGDGAVLGSIAPGLGSGGWPRASGVLVAGDLDGDGIGDVVTHDANPNAVSFWPGPHQGQSEPGGTFATRFAPSQTLAADVTGDGLPDVLAGNGDAVWTLSAPPRAVADLRDVAIARYRASEVLSGFGAGDLDGDGSIDPILGTNGRSTWVTGITSGAVDVEVSSYAELTTARATSGVTVAVGDFDGDGQDDLALGGSQFIQQYEGHSDRSLWVAYGPLQGVVDLDAEAVVRNYGPYTRFTEGLMAGDVDGDGADEVVASGNLGSAFDTDGDETVWVFLRP